MNSIILNIPDDFNKIEEMLINARYTEGIIKLVDDDTRIIIRDPNDFLIGTVAKKIEEPKSASSQTFKIRGGDD